MNRIILAATSLIACCGTAAANPQFDKEHMIKAINEIPRQADWKPLEIGKFDDYSIEVRLTYRTLPQSGRPEQDTMAIARAVLKELVAEGRHPSQDQTFIYVSAKQDGIKGETGAALVRLFGHTLYENRADRLVWEPPGTHWYD